MAVQEQNGCSGSDSSLNISDKISIDLGTPTVKGIQLKQQFNSGDDCAPKVRKPYTITKQRERWTEDEHKKFLEALKLYGRAWRRIEEHVGTKTAVQIRSHAQKFFSKVVRESNTCDDSPVKPIEIPPPRPKRKPMHPYPRKLVSPVKTGISIPEKPMSSASPSTLEPENQSPTSVFSAIGSDSSSVSSALALDAGNIFYPEAPKLVSSGDVIMSSRPDCEDENSSADEQIHLELDLSSQNTAVLKEDANESAAQILKLFGKTLLVNQLVDGTDGTDLLPRRVVPLKLPTSTFEYAWTAFSDGSPMPVYSTETKSNLLCSQMMGDELNPIVALRQVPSSWLTICSDASYLTLEVHSPIPIKAKPLCDKKENVEDDEQKEGSSTGSNSDLVGGKSWDIDCLPERKGKEAISFSSYKLRKNNSGLSVNSAQGFVPYKRCLEKQDSTVSSTGTPEEREKQRIRLCL